VAKEIDMYIDANCESRLIKEAIKYFDLSSGKCIRANLLKSLSEVYGIKKSDSDLLASIVEMVHSASLMLDDLPCMDNHESRRKKKSLHVKYDESTSILSSFSLFFIAIKMCTESSLKDSEKNKIINRIVSVLSPSGMAYGQLMDLTSRSNPLRTEEIYNIFRLKTGILFGLIADLVNVLKNIPDKDLLKEILIHLGCLYQAIDDSDDMKKENTDALIDNDEKYNIIKNMAISKIREGCLSLNSPEVNHIIKDLVKGWINEDIFYQIS